MAKPPKRRPATHRRGYIPWRILMRQLGIDVETCPRCEGKMKVIALEFAPVRPLGHTSRASVTRPLPRSTSPEGFCTTYRPVAESDGASDAWIRRKARD
jgi:hypothetical protein